MTIRDNPALSGNGNPCFVLIHHYIGRAQLIINFGYPVLGLDYSIFARLAR